MTSPTDLNQLIDDSTNLLTQYYADASNTAVENLGETGDSQDEGMTELVSVITNTTQSLKTVMTRGRATRIDANKLQSLQAAVDKFLKDPSVEHKIEVLKFSISGLNQSFLRGMQELQRVVKALRRGERTEEIDEEGGLEP